jgi:hypothetical protein
MVNKRREYNTIKKKYDEIGKGKVRLTESTLILEQPIDPNKTVYQFPVLESDPPVNQEEIRLNINDEFVATECGLFIVANIFAEADANTISSMWFTTPPYEIGTAGLVNMQNLYRGFLKMTVNNVTYIDKWDTKKHEYRGVTQFQNSSVGIPSSTAPQQRWSEDAMIALTPTITFSGAKKNLLELVMPNALIFPAGMVWTVPTAGQNLTISIQRIALVYRGWLAQNASSFQK